MPTTMRFRPGSAGAASQRSCDGLAAAEMARLGPRVVRDEGLALVFCPGGRP